MPRVSVIITTFNRSALLVEALHSVLAQSFQDYEVIVVDDGSTDDTPARIAAFAGHVRYLPLQHSGRLGHLRNAGVLAAQGDYVAFLDDDDLWHPAKLERQVSVLDGNASTGLVYTDARLLLPDGSLSEPVLLTHQKQADDLFDHLIVSCFIHPSTVLVRRSLLQQLGLFDTGLTTQEDYDCWLRATRLAGTACVPEPLVFVRRHPASHSQQSDIVNYHNAILVLQRALRTSPRTLQRQLRSRMTLAR